MYILAHDPKHVTCCLGEVEQIDRAVGDIFGAFQYNDLEGEGVVWKSLKDGGDLEGYRWIFEGNSRTSQLDRLVACGEGLPVVGVSYMGRGFRGQFGRQWEMLPGNLALCLYVPGRWQIIDWNAVCALQMLPCEAVMAAIGEVCGQSDGRLKIKAPNDIVVDGDGLHKLAGCLTEFRVCGDVLSDLRFGIGINIVAAPEIRNGLPATCLCEYLMGDVEGEKVWRVVLIGVIKTFTRLLNPIINRRFF